MRARRERSTIESTFLPLQYLSGYLPIEDHGLIGDGTTAALVGRDGSLVWLCLPRFDSPPIFSRILDARKGGEFLVTLDGAVQSCQRYEPDTGVLVTEVSGQSGLIRLTDALALRSGADLSDGTAPARGELVRSVQVLQGPVRVHVVLDPLGGATAEGRGDGIRVRCRARPDLDLQLFSSRPLSGLRQTLELDHGEVLDLVLRWGPGQHRRLSVEAEELLADTRESWLRWTGRIDYHGPQEPLVRRSAVTLKMLDFMENGAIIAAPTSSLPEAIGGPRNWDYRYAWVRDAAFSVYALRRIGLPREAWSFVEWVLDAAEREGRPRVMYNLDGYPPPAEREDAILEGYRRSTPVRWGNAAADQSQHDVYGEIVDCAYQWVVGGGSIDGALWQRLRSLIETALLHWNRPDHGIWEVRTAARPFTYSAALCQVALERGARIASTLGLAGDADGWRRSAEVVRAAILREAWDDKSQSLTEHLGGGGLDASLLALPLRRVIPATHPRMVATTAAITERLGAGKGLIYRYLPTESPDGLPGDEGAFLLCSFWLVENLAYQGRLDEAMTLYESLCGRTNGLGLLAEQIDPVSGAFLGNYPQSFSHIGLISSGVNLARQIREVEGKGQPPRR